MWLARWRMRLLRDLFGFDDEESFGEVAVHRFFEACVVLWTIEHVARWAEQLETITRVVRPLGLGHYIDVSPMFGDSPWPEVNALVIACLLLLGFARVSRFAYAGALLLTHWQYVARWCLGKASHGASFIGLSLMMMALGALLFHDRKRARRTAMGGILFFFGAGYMSAAFSKLIATGPHWIDGYHLWLWIGERSVDMHSETGAFNMGLVQSLATRSRAFATLLLAGGFFAELFAFLLWFRKTRPFVALVLLGMHFGIGLAMNIVFAYNMALLAMAAFPWAVLINQTVARLDSRHAGRLRELATRLG